MLYNRKAELDGDGAQNLRQAYSAALSAADRLEAEPEFRGKLKFSRNEVEVVLNDRLLYPNTDETWSVMEGDFTSFFDDVLGAGQYSLYRATDPRERFRVVALRHG